MSTETLTEAIEEARRCARSLGKHPLATPCMCDSCQAYRALMMCANVLEYVRMMRADWSITQPTDKQS